MRLFKRRAEARTASVDVDRVETRRPSLAVGIPVSVVTGDGSRVCEARLARFDAWELRLGRLPGELSLPVLESGTRVRVTGRSEDGLESFVLGATVEESTRLFLRVGSLEPVVEDGRRSEERHGVWRPGELFDVVDVRRREVPVPCEVVDVSGTGARVRSERAFPVDRTLRLRVELYEGAGAISFLSQVVRVSSLPDGRVEMGLIFEELSRQKRRYLDDDLRGLRERAERRARS